MRVDMISTPAAHELLLEGDGNIAAPNFARLPMARTILSTTTDVLVHSFPAAILPE